MKNKYLIFGFSALGAFILGYLLFSTCNPISNKCYAKESSENINIVDSQHLSPVEFNSALNSGKYKLIDIRTIEEFNSGHIGGAENIDFYKTQEFLSYLDQLDKNEKYLIYCRSGNRTGQALSMMKARGLNNVQDLSGGINAWSASGLPIK